MVPMVSKGTQLNSALYRLRAASVASNNLSITHPLDEWLKLTPQRVINLQQYYRFVLVGVRGYQ